MTTKPRLSISGWHFAILVLFLMMVAVLPASAAVHTISPGDSIQTAIYSASDGDTIILNPGTYSENGIAITAKNLTFRAADGHGPSDTIIDGKSAAPRIFTVTDASSLNIENLTLRNGRAGNGARGSDEFTGVGSGKPGGSGGAILSSGPVTITSSSITGCSAGKGGDGGDGIAPIEIWVCRGGNGAAGGNGGAIYSTGSVTLTSSMIAGCSAGNGGDAGKGGGLGDNGAPGKGGNGGAIFSTGSVTLTSSTISGSSAGTGGRCAQNEVSGNGGSGGAIWGPGVTLTSSTISDCSAGNGGKGGPAGKGGNGGSGGAVYSPSTVTLTSSTISGCTAGAGGHGPQSNDGSTGGDGGNGGSGGGIYAPGTVTLASSLIDDCSSGARGTGTTGSWFDGHHGIGGWGGGVFTTTSATVTGSTVTDCHTEKDGGAIFADTGSATVDTSTFATCTAGGNGGAVRSLNQATITDSTFTSCVAGSKGGAIYTEYGVTATSSTFESCSAPSGGAAYGRSGPITFCRLVNNDAAGTAIYSPKGAFDATNNWWGDNSDPSAQVGAGVSCSPWLVLGITTTPPPLTTQDYLVEADLTYDSDGVWHDPALGHVPDGIQVFYAVESGSGTGSLSSASAGTAAGISQTIFTSTQAGTANVTATVDDQTVSALIERPIAAFTADDLSVVRQKQAAVFTDQTISSLPLTYAWDFGDGSTSTEQNPDHVYQKEDVYTVSLTISNALGHDKITQENYLFATPPNPLKANFMGENKNGENPLEVQFTDHSLVSVKVPSYPAIDAWLWDFGDGNTSTEQHPEHTYLDAGRYSVTLTVSNALDNDTKSKDFITVKKDIKLTKKNATGAEASGTGDLDPSLDPLPEEPGVPGDEEDEGDGVEPGSTKGKGHTKPDKHDKDTADNGALNAPKPPKD